MTISELLKDIPIVDSQINYWLIRTSAGKYYDEFVKNGRIGYGEDYVLPEEVLQFPHRRDEFYKYISPIIEKHTESDRPGTTAGQFYRFYHEIRKGDIVIIPSESSERLWIGKVIDEKPEKFEFLDENKEISCPHIHTRRIEWITEKRRSGFNPKVISLFFSHHAIVDAREYADYINGAIYDCFISQQQAHLVLRIRTNQHIRARTLFSVMLSILDITQQADECVDDKIDVDEVDIRINLNSPGVIELISPNLVTILAIGIIVVLISGGKLKSKWIELGTDGLLKQCFDFINKREAAKLQAEIVRHALTDLEMKDPKEVVKLIDKVLK